MSQTRRHTALVAYRALSDVAGKGAFFLVTLAAARRLSPESFGVFSLGTTVGWIAAVATDFGIQLHLARAVAQHPGAAPDLLRSWLRVRLWTSALAVLTVTVGLALTSGFSAPASAILMFTSVYVLNGLVEFLHYFYRGLSRSDVESTLTLLQRAAMLVLALLALWWMPNVTLLGVALLIPAAVTFGYSLRLAKHLADSMPPAIAEGPISLPDARQAVDSVIPIGAGIVLSALYFRIDVFLVQAWQGTIAVGQYNAVFRLVEALRLFPAAVLAVAMPVLFRATSRRTLVKLSSLLTVAAVLVSALLWMSAGLLIPLLYGDRYAAAVPAFQVLLVAFPLMSLNYALTHQLIGWHGHRAYAVMCLAALGFNIALNVKLIPAAGIVGASWATVATELVITFGCLIALGRLSPLPVVADPTSRASDVSSATKLSSAVVS